MIESHFKVLIVVTRGTVGGAQTSVFNLARQLDRGGQADVTVGSGEGEHLALRCRAAGIEHVRFQYLRRSLNPIYAVRSIVEFVRHFNQEQYDVVHINSSNALFAALAAKLSKKKPWIVFTFRGLSLLDEHYEMSSLKRRLYIWIYRILLAFVDEPVFVSFENFETATRMGLVKEGAGTVIYNGLDPEELVFEDRSEARQALAELSGAKITDETFLIGSIGRLAYQKNYEFLIDQIADLSGKHPLLKVVIIGDGPLHKTIL
ncbi:MAG: glycosyltransferase, partial [Candidatus Paceibacterota bacterium]